MDDRTAAGAGALLAVVAVVAAIAELLGATSPLLVPVALLAGLAAAAFGLRSSGRMDREVASLVAGGTAGIALLSWLAVAATTAISEATAIGIAAIGTAVVAAYADWLGLDAEAVGSRMTSVAQAAAIAAAGILAIYAWLLPLSLLVGALAPAGVGRAGEIVLSTLASGAGTVSVVVLYLRWSRRGVQFLDVRMPTRRELGYVVGGTAAILAGNVAIGLAFQRVGVEVTTHTIVRMAAADPTVLLALVPLSYLVIAPGEELLYRNVVQKSLRETFSPVAGVVIASVVFAAVHLPSYIDPEGGLGATASTLVVVFVLALVLGAIYERTDNVVVSVLAHGTFNAIAFAATYAQLSGLAAG